MMVGGWPRWTDQSIYWSVDVAIGEWTDIRMGSIAKPRWRISMRLLGCCVSCKVALVQCDLKATEYVRSHPRDRGRRTQEEWLSVIRRCIEAGYICSTVVSDLMTHIEAFYSCDIAAIASRHQFQWANTWCPEVFCTFYIHIFIRPNMSVQDVMCTINNCDQRRHVLRPQQIALTRPNWNIGNECFYVFA